MKEEITAPMADNQTWNSCYQCGKAWQDKVPTPGLLHRTTLCKKCSNKGKKNANRRNTLS